MPKEAGPGSWDLLVSKLTARRDGAVKPAGQALVEPPAFVCMFQPAHALHARSGWPAGWQTANQAAREVGGELFSFSVWLYHPPAGLLLVRWPPS